MISLAITLQLQMTLQAIPIAHVIPKQYDVDIQVIRGADTVYVPGLRLADGLEGRLMFARQGGVTLQVQTMVKADAETRCRIVTIGFGEVMQERNAVVDIPRVTGYLCEGETIRMKSETGPTIIATVSSAKVAARE